MFDVYERINLYNEKNPKMSICEPYDNGISLIKRYAGFLILKGGELSFNRNQKEEFLKELIEQRNNDVISNILEQDFESSQKKQLIEFWYIPENLADEINQLKLQVMDDFKEKEKQQIRKLENEGLVFQLVLIFYREKFAKDFNIKNAKNMILNFFHLNYDEIQDKGSTHFIERIAISVNSYYQYFTGHYINIWSSILIVAVILGIVVFQNCIIALVLLLLVPINYFGYKFLNKELMNRSKILQE